LAGGAVLMKRDAGGRIVWGACRRIRRGADLIILKGELGKGMWISLVEGTASGEVLWMDFVDGRLSAEFSRVHDVLLLRTSE